MPWELIARKLHLLARVKPVRTICIADSRFGLFSYYNYSTVTDFAKFLGLSTSVPLAQAV